MSDETFDNIPLLDDLIENGTSTEAVFTIESVPAFDLETKINNILQRHTSQAVAEIVAIIESNKNNND